MNPMNIPLPPGDEPHTGLDFHCEDVSAARNTLENNTFRAIKATLDAAFGGHITNDPKALKAQIAALRQMDPLAFSSQYSAEIKGLEKKCETATKECKAKESALRAARENFRIKLRNFVAMGKSTAKAKEAEFRALLEEEKRRIREEAAAQGLGEGALPNDDDLRKQLVDANTEVHRLAAELEASQAREREALERIRVEEEHLAELQRRVGQGVEEARAQMLEAARADKYMFALEAVRKVADTMFHEMWRRLIGQSDHDRYSIVADRVKVMIDEAKAQNAGACYRAFDPKRPFEFIMRSDMTGHVENSAKFDHDDDEGKNEFMREVKSWMRAQRIGFGGLMADAYLQMVLYGATFVFNIQGDAADDAKPTSGSEPSHSGSAFPIEFQKMATVIGPKNRVSVSEEEIIGDYLKNPIKLEQLSAKGSDQLLGSIVNGFSGAHRYNTEFDAANHQINVSVSINTNHSHAPVMMQFEPSSSLVRSTTRYRNAVIDGPEGIVAETTRKQVEGTFGQYINDKLAQVAFASYLDAHRDDPEGTDDWLGERLGMVYLALSLGYDFRAGNLSSFDLIKTQDANRANDGEINHFVRNLDAGGLRVRDGMTASHILIAFKHLPPWTQAEFAPIMHLLRRISVSSCGFAMDNPLTAGYTSTPQLVLIGESNYRPALALPDQFDPVAAATRITPQVVLRTISLLAFLLGTEEELARGFNLAISRNLVTRTLTSTATPLPLPSKLKYIGEQVEDALWARLLVMLNTNPVWRTANAAHRAHYPFLPWRPESCAQPDLRAPGNHGVVANPELEALTTATFGRTPAGAAVLAPRTLHFWRKWHMWEQGMQGEIANKCIAAGDAEVPAPVPTVSAHSFDCQFWERMLDADVSSKRSAMNYIASNFTTDEIYRLAAWVADDPHAFAADRDADNRDLPVTFEERWRVQSAAVRGACSIPAQVEGVNVTLANLAAGLFDFEHFRMPVCGFNTDITFKTRAGFETTRRLMMRKSPLTDASKSEAFARTLKVKAGDALLSYIGMYLVMVRSAADIGVDAAAITRSTALMAGGVVALGSETLNDLAHKSSVMAISVSNAALISGALEASAGAEEFLGLDNPIFDYVASGQCELTLPPQMTTSTVEGGLHDPLICTPPPLLSFIVPGTVIVDPIINSASAWYTTDNAGTSNFSANFKLEGLTTQQFFAATKKLCLRAGYDYKTTVTVPYIDRATSQRIEYEPIEERRHELHARRPDFATYSDTFAFDILGFERPILPVLVQERLCERRAPGATDITNVRRAQGSALVPVTPTYLYVDINTRQSQALHQNIMRLDGQHRDFDYWQLRGLDIGVKFSAIGHFERAGTGAVDVFDAREFIRQTLNGQKQHASRLQKVEHKYRVVVQAAGAQVQTSFLACRAYTGADTTHYYADAAVNADLPLEQYTKTRARGYQVPFAGVMGRRHQDHGAETAKALSNVQFAAIAQMVREANHNADTVICVNYHPFAELTPFDVKSAPAWEKFVQESVVRPRAEKGLTNSRPERKVRRFGASKSSEMGNEAIRLGESETKPATNSGSEETVPKLGDTAPGDEPSKEERSDSST